jgi:hypothetical protein
MWMNDGAKSVVAEVDKIETPEERKRRRITEARAALAARYEADPEGVQRFQSRMARLAAVKKRERERFEHLVIGKARPKAPTGKRMRKGKALPVALPPGIEEAVALREDWSHKANGTPETWEYATRTHQGALAQLHLNGSINDDQLAWAAEIAKAAESIERDVDVRTASLEARVDMSRHGTEAEQRLSVVRLHMAYTHWREQLPAPKRLVLDMLVGDPIGFTVAARRHRVHHRRAKRELIAAIDRWPNCLDRARAEVDQEDLDYIAARLA